MRLDRYISRFVGLSRSQSRSIIRNGRVTVNGLKTRDVSLDVRLESEVSLDGTRVEAFDTVTIMLNKPAGYVCSRSESEGPKVFELIQGNFVDELSIAGRLDRDATGLVILSNDGKFVHTVISPRKKVEKEYHVCTEFKVSDEQLTCMRQGLMIGPEEFSRPVAVERRGDKELTMILIEGRFHEVKRLVKASGNTVIKLHRRRIGNLLLPTSLEEGSWVFLDEESLKKITGAL